MACQKEESGEIGLLLDPGARLSGSVRGFKGRFHTSCHLLQNAQNLHSGHSIALRFAHSLHSAIVRDQTGRVGSNSVKRSGLMGGTGYQGDLVKRSMSREPGYWRIVWSMTGLVCKGYQHQRNGNNFIFYKLSDKISIKQISRQQIVLFKYSKTMYY